MSILSFVEANRTRIVLTVLVALVLIVYFQAVGFQFINLDDNLYVYSNQQVVSGLNWESVKWAFTAFYSANWHPLTWISHMLDAQFFGLNPGGHHATNVILHLVNSILVFSVFQKMTGAFWRSAIVAVLFAVHPTHVESVAWVSERKDVLSTLFWLLAMHSYTSYASAIENRDTAGVFAYLRSWKYWIVVLLMAAGLLAKPVVVTLPFVLLLLDFWPLDRFRSRRDVLALFTEKIPMLIIVAGSSIVTVIAQKSAGAIESLDYLPFGMRMLNAVNAYFDYISKMFYPADLAVFYSYDTDIPLGAVAIKLLILSLVTVVCIWRSRSQKFLLFGWLWFGGTLVPMIGIVQVGVQSMADRYTYISFLGLFVMIVWGVADFAKTSGKVRKFAIAAAVAAIVALTWLAHNQTRLWKDNETLYVHTLAVTKNNFVIAQNLCHALMTENRLTEAEMYCRKGIEMRPNYMETYNTLGVIQMKRSEFEEAEKSFRKTLELSPGYAVVWSNLATVQSLLGRPAEAEVSLETAVRLSEGTLDPTIFIEPLNGLANAYAAKGNYEKVSENLARAIYLAPNRADLRFSLALALFEMKNIDGARQQIENALTLENTNPIYLNFYGRVLIALDRKPEAAAVLEQALKLKPDLEDAKQNLKVAKGEK